MGRVKYVGSHCSRGVSGHPGKASCHYIKYYCIISHPSRFPGGASFFMAIFQMGKLSSPTSPVPPPQSLLYSSFGASPGATASSHRPAGS